MKTKRVVLVSVLALLLLACNQSGMVSTAGSGSGDVGRAGSMARFAIVGDMLYAIASNQLQLINIEEPGSPVLWSRVNVDFGIETLFPYGDYLFIGSQSGVFIYDNSDPYFPRYKSDFSHARSCDPVVVQDHYAYVTLRGNGGCWGGLNQLDILDIADVERPVLVKSYPMQEPEGLGISGNALFICDGAAGLKVFDVEQNSSIQVLQTLANVKCYDVIPHNGVLLVSAENGIKQYSYDSIPMTELSEIKVEVEETNGA